VGKLLNWLNLGRILLFWDLNYNILTSNITDAAGSAAAQPGHVIGKSAARPIVIAWLVASGEFSCCLAVAVATRPPIGDVYILLGLRRRPASFDHFFTGRRLLSDRQQSSAAACHAFCLGAIRALRLVSMGLRWEVMVSGNLQSITPVRNNRECELS